MTGLSIYNYYYNYQQKKTSRNHIQLSKFGIVLKYFIRLVHNRRTKMLVTVTPDPSNLLNEFQHQIRKEKRCNNTLGS